MVFCFWSLLLSSSAVEAQHCLRRRSPCVRRRQRDRGPSLLAPKKPQAAAGALAVIQQRCRVYRGPLLLAPKTPMRPLRRRRPCVHRRQRCQGHSLLAHFPIVVPSSITFAPQLEGHKEELTHNERCTHKHSCKLGGADAQRAACPATQM